MVMIATAYSRLSPTLSARPPYDDGYKNHRFDHVLAPGECALMNTAEPPELL